MGDVFLLFVLSAFLRNFFLRQDRLSGDVPPHLVQPCYVALGWALIWGGGWWLWLGEMAIVCQHHIVHRGLSVSLT